MGPTGPKSMAAAVGLEKTRASADRVRAVLGTDTVGTVGTVVADVEAVRVGVVTTGVGAGGPSTATVSVRLTQP